MLLGIFFTYQVWIFICNFKASADWELSCYNESLQIHCDPEKTIIIHEAHFGYFREVLLISNSTNRCRAHNSRDCWVDVTANISRRCSGHSVCKNTVHYSSDLSADLLARECPFIIDDAAEPTLFVEYDCIPTTLVTRISNENHVDPEQIGGYLISLDYNEIVKSGSEWRSHLAEAMCNPESNHLPHQFYLPAPKIAATKYSVNDDDAFNSYGESGHRENNHDRLVNKGSLATFILRIKDIGLTKSTTNTNGISSAFASSSSSSTSSLSSFGSVLSNNNNNININNNNLILATGSACPSNPGIACSHDYLSVDARISNVYDGTISNIPIIRFCSINNFTLKTTTTKRETELTNSSFASGSFSLNSIDSNKLYPLDESYLVGQIYGPISNVYGLQFTSNLNLLDPYIIHGKGIVLEYIALLCVPINPPSGNGVVDYRFRVNQQTSHTFAYAEVFCPSDRWLEPMDPDLDEINPSQSSSSFSSTGNRSSLNNDSIPNPWWLQRRRHITLICDHHERKWIPNRLPEACLTSDELATFVAQITKNLQKMENKNTKLSLNSNQLDMNSSDEMMLKILTNVDQSEFNTTHTSLYLKAANDNDQVTHLSSVALGSILGILIFLLATFLVVCSLRHKLFEHYHKTIDLAAISSSNRLGSCSLGTFSRSKDTLLFPTCKRSLMSFHNNNNSNNNHDHIVSTNGNLFKSYPYLLSHNTINGSFPDFSNTAQQQQPTFLLHSSTVSGVNKKPSNIDFITDGHLPPWRNSSMKRNQKPPTAISALTLVPNTPSSDRRQIMNSLPWLRTNSTSHISSTNGAPPAFNHNTNHTNSTTTNNNNHSRFGASSETILFPSLNPPNGIPRSWWLPWRRSMRKKRRLYTQLQRRQEIQSLSQRGLLESSGSFLGKSTPQLPNNRHLMTSSNNSGLLTNDNVSRFGTTAEPSLPMIPISSSPSSTSSLSNKEELNHQHPYSNHVFLRSERSGSERTQQSTRTLITATNNSSNSGIVSALYANDDQANSPIYTKYPMNLPSNNNSNRDNISSAIYPKTNSNIQSISWINVNDNDLPWKFTPPSRNSFSNGIRRLSSFFRSFNQSNGSFTPPRYQSNNHNNNSYGLSYKKSSLRSSSFNTSRTEIMPSMPVLPTFNYLATSNNNNNNSSNIVPLTSHYPVDKQHFDSFRLSGRHVTHPLIQPSLQSVSESNDLHRKHHYIENMWSTQTVKPSLFHQDAYQHHQNHHTMYSSGDEHTTINDMLSRNTTKTSLQGSSRIDSLLSTEFIDLCNNNNGGSSTINHIVKNDPLVKLNSTTVTSVKQTIPNSMYNSFLNYNKLDYIEKDELNHLPYLTTDPYLEPVSLKRKQQQEKRLDHLITAKKIHHIDHDHDMECDTVENKNDDLIKLNKTDQQPAVHSGTSSAISSLVFADDSDLSKVSEHSINSQKSDQYSSLHLITSQTVSSNEINSMNNNNNSIINVTKVITNGFITPTTITTTNLSIPTATSIVSNADDIVPLPRVKHPTTIDYVTYDEIRSYDKKNNRFSSNTTTGQRPYSIDSNCIPLNSNNKLVAGTSTVVSSMLSSDHEVQRRINAMKGDSDSRPLSDAMISNHYYDLNRNINYQEISMESSLQEEEKRNPNHQILCKSHPPLPPLWSNNNNINTMEHFNKNHAINTTDSNNNSNRNFGSMDSLYETVDLPRTNLPTPMITPTTMIQQQQHLMDFRNTVNNEHIPRRSSMALPPTPSSILNLKAPIRSIGEMDDWNLPSCSDDSE
ncbi:unnamed protein product [Schistosoma rodhaini]|uniref:SUEL-type lectin domain-containing protein n=2 Tax=Schistosoma TaxID=6181 RepID=A0AA85GE34_9TREM|nr:unnamed protein product [Schistosoma rodhaini]